MPEILIADRGFCSECGHSLLANNLPDGQLPCPHCGRPRVYDLLPNKPFAAANRCRELQDEKKLLKHLLLNLHFEANHLKDLLLAAIDGLRVSVALHRAVGTEPVELGIQCNADHADRVELLIAELEKSTEKLEPLRRMP